MPRIIKEMLPRIISEDTGNGAADRTERIRVPLVIRGSPSPDLSSNRVAEVVHHTYIYQF